jgi:hypothetical protein
MNVCVIITVTIVILFRGFRSHGIIFMCVCVVNRCHGNADEGC